MISLRSNQGWLVSPAFDLLFICNLPWILLLLPWGESGPIEFAQLYFITTPHRWLTLALVFLDPDRREGRSNLFIALAAISAALTGAVWFITGDFLCLLLIDYIWNGWHFASQHAGVLCVYSRKCGDNSRPLLERHGLRLLICYVIARTAGWSTGWLESISGGATYLACLDALALGLAAWIVLPAFIVQQSKLPKQVYLISVCSLYSALLVAMMIESRWLVGSLTIASALFHATEYIALVTHYAWRRETLGSGGIFQIMATRWITFLCFFALSLGLAGAWIHTSGTVPAWWMGANIWAAFLHYAYDGMIWKLRRPETAKALGATA